MSIRMLAVELYRAKTAVAELEKKLGAADMGAQERAQVEQQLRVARAEEMHIKSMLEGAKES